MPGVPDLEGVVSRAGDLVGGQVGTKFGVNFLSTLRIDLITRTI
jgi:hypothetical protein